MTKLFLGVFDIMVSLFLWVPFGIACLMALGGIRRIFRHKLNRKTVSVLAFSLFYIGAFAYLYIYRPDALAPVFCMITCLVPVVDSSRRLVKEKH
ncbi:MAG: hypothetical protein IJM96_00525 [Clostridia bacterium]|nr:hypothetical protein [Clostridia bacterium]